VEVLNAVILNEEQQVLLVRKKDVWILPGGKPLESEADVACLRRELKEELPKLKRVKIVKHITTLNGAKTPHTKKELEAKIYLVKINSQSRITPAAEIEQAEWTAKPENYKLSEMTKKIINYLKQKNIMNSKK